MAKADDVKDLVKAAKYVAMYLKDAAEGHDPDESVIVEVNDLRDLAQMLLKATESV